MKVVCAWCGILIRESKKIIISDPSHGICSECVRGLEKQFLGDEVEPASPESAAMENGSGSETIDE